MLPELTCATKVFYTHHSNNALPSLSILFCFAFGRISIPKKFNFSRHKSVLASTYSSSQSNGKSLLSKVFFFLLMKSFHCLVCEDKYLPALFHSPEKKRSRSRRHLFFVVYEAVLFVSSTSSKIQFGNFDLLSMNTFQEIYCQVVLKT